MEIHSSWNDENMGFPIMVIKPNRLFMVINSQLETGSYATCLMSWAYPQDFTNNYVNDG
jgi:hypothetical protein